MKLKGALEALTPVIAEEAVNHFQSRITEGKDIYGKPFKKRKRDAPNRRGRAILVKSGNLRRAIRIAKMSSGNITIENDMPYAKIHNDGGEINHPGGTPYLPFNQRYTARKRRGRIDSMGESQMVFLKKDGDYPEGTKFTKPHKIPMPERKFMGDSPQVEAHLTALAEKELARRLK
jgi:phage gpG-like protein